MPSFITMNFFLFFFLIRIFIFQWTSNKIFHEKPSPVFGSCTWQRREDVGVVSEHFILILVLLYKCIRAWVYVWAGSLYFEYITWLMPGGGGNIFFIKTSYFFSKSEKWNIGNIRLLLRVWFFVVSLFRKKLLCCSSGALNFCLSKGL